MLEQAEKTCPTNAWTKDSLYTPSPLTPSNFPYPKRFREIVTNMADLYERKNSDYGNSFAETIDKLGYAAGLARIYDKWNRLCQLSKHNGEGQIKDESMLDTAIDGACYFIMLAMEIERLNPKPIKVPVTETVLDEFVTISPAVISTSNCNPQTGGSLR